MENNIKYVKDLGKALNVFSKSLEKAVKPIMVNRDDKQIKETLGMLKEKGLDIDEKMKEFKQQKEDLDNLLNSL